MDHLNRNKSVITENNNLESLYTLKVFPVYMGCTDNAIENDIFSDMEWMIDPESGCIQLNKLIPLEILYLHQHNDGTGKIWKDMYREFADFIYKHAPISNILEIGGAHDQIALNYLEKSKVSTWTIIEPNPGQIDNEKINFIKGWFDETFKLNKPIDTIVHSHILEHVFDPKLFLKHIGSFLQEGQKHIFAFPNLQPMLENKYTNAINFEHTIFLTEYFTDLLLKEAGFKIIKKQYFGNPHSIFYLTTKDSKQKPSQLINKYTEYKKIFNEYVNHHKEMTDEINTQISKLSQPIYLFGAHIFSQTLIGFGLKTDKILNILDNSKIKQEKRLYGTNLIVKSPKILKDQGPVTVILKAGIYNEEIKKDILENINNKVTFL